MTDPNLTPPPELVQEWWEEVLKDTSKPFVVGLTTRAAQWGADMELEACCEVLQGWRYCRVEDLRAIRRPKPPTLNSIALQMLGTIERDGHYLPEITETIRRALEQLDD